VTKSLLSTVIAQYPSVATSPIFIGIALKNASVNEKNDTNATNDTVKLLTSFSGNGGSETVNKYMRVIKPTTIFANGATMAMLS